MTATRTRVSDGRWHFQHGPIDIIVGAEGSVAALEAAHEAAWQRFQPVLDELVRELPLLRLPVGGRCPLQGRIARRMWQACQPYSASYITPMAAVAGAVAEELVGCYDRAGVERAWINNGGDIALYLAPSQSVRVGLYADLARTPVALDPDKRGPIGVTSHRIGRQHQRVGQPGRYDFH